jgi:glutamyl-tRNA synthetase
VLGWAAGDNREIVPWEEALAEFRLEDVNPSSAFFDVRKLRAFNGDYIRAMPLADFIQACRPWTEGSDVPWRSEAYDVKAFGTLAELAQTRIVLLSDIVEMVDFAFLDEPAIDDEAWIKTMKDGSADLLAATITAYESADWNAAELKSLLETGLTLFKQHQMHAEHLASMMK